MKRVVITGMGAVTPIGNNVADFWDSIKNGRHGFDFIKDWDTSNCEVKLATQVKDFNPLLAMEKKELRRTDLYCQYALEAARQAVLDADMNTENIDPYRVGVIVGSGIGGFHSTHEEHTKFMEKGGKRVSVFYIPMMITNIAAGTIAMKHNFKGSNYSPVSACASATHAIGEAYRAVKHGYLDACVTGGAEATVMEFAVWGFHNMKALSVSQNPDYASIPFDKNRDGFIMGEGAGILMIEELEHAKARGAKIYAEIVGYGATGDAYHMTSPDPEGEGAAKGMELAFTEAGLKAEDVDYINTHGTSTPLNDKYETIAIKKAFGEHAKNIYVNSTKSMTGHLLGAAGGIEAIVCAKALEEGFVPQTIGTKEADPDCDLNNMTAGPLQENIEVALSNSLGFGGHNATLCLKKYK